MKMLCEGCKREFEFTPKGGRPRRFCEKKCGQRYFIRKWRKENPEKARETSRKSNEKQRKYRDYNAEECRKKDRDYRRKNITIIRETSRKSIGKSRAAKRSFAVKIAITKLVKEAERVNNTQPDAENGTVIQSPDAR